MPFTSSFFFPFTSFFTGSGTVLASVMPVSFAISSLSCLKMPHKANMMGKLIDPGSLIHIEATQIMNHKSRVIKTADSISGTIDYTIEE